MREFGLLSEDEAETIRHEQADRLASSDKLGRSAELAPSPESDPIAKYRSGPSVAEMYRTVLERDRVRTERYYTAGDLRDKLLERNEKLRQEVDVISDDAVLAALSRPSARLIRGTKRLRKHENDGVFADAIEHAGGPLELANQLKHLSQFTDAGYKVRSESPESKNTFVLQKPHIDEGILLALQKLAVEYPETRDICEQTVQDVLLEQSRYALEHPIDVGVLGQFQDQGLEGLKKEFYVESHQMAEPIMRDAFWVLGEIGSEKSISFLKGWMKDEDPDFIPDIAKIIQKISPEKTAKEFLPELRSDSRYMRIAARYILQRLEFGRIGMSKGEVEYLDTRYQFDDDGREGDVAERLTPDGKIGVFKDGTLFGYFPIDFDAGGQTVSASLSAIQYHDLFLERADLSPEEAEIRDDVAREYAERVLEHFEHPIFKDANIALNNFTLQEQGWLLAHIKQTSPAEQGELADFAKRFEESGLKTFVTMEFGQARASHIMELSRTLEPEHAAQLFERFASYVEVNRARIPDIQTRLQEVFPDLSVGESELEEAIVHRASELIETVYTQTRETKDAGGQGEIVGQLLADFSRETDVESFLTSRLLKISEVFERENIDLRKFASEQRALLGAIQDSSYRGIFARALATRTHLEPIPRVYWEVDRTSEDYSERFGFDVRELLETVRVPEGEKGLIVEFGPGSGMAKSERSPLIREKFVDVGVADRLYYPLNTTIENAVDFDALEKGSGAALSPEERARLADVIYKALVIQPGQEADDSFEHNDELLQKFAKDPEYLRTALAGIGERLAGVSVVPETRMQKDAEGHIVHRDKIRDEEQSENWQRAKAAFAAAPERFLRQESIYNAIPVHAPGIAFADFGDVERLANDQIDVALAVRSTVYKTGEEYDAFLRSVARKLKRDGVWLDDSIRENGGAGYRLGTHLRFSNEEREAGRHEETYVILGPGIAGEDPYREGAVPLSFLRTANNRATIFAREHLSPGFQMMEIERLCSGEYDEWIRELDPSEKTLVEVESARAKIQRQQRSTKAQTESENSEQFPRAA